MHNLLCEKGKPKKSLTVAFHLIHILLAKFVLEELATEEEVKKVLNQGFHSSVSSSRS